MNICSTSQNNVCGRVVAPFLVPCAPLAESAGNENRGPRKMKIELVIQILLLPMTPVTQITPKSGRRNRVLEAVMNDDATTGQSYVDFSTFTAD